MKSYALATFIVLSAILHLRSEQPTSKTVSARLAGEHTISSGSGGMIQGDVQITFDDGRTEVITHDGKCLAPEVSKNGAVYWIQCSGISERGYPLNEKIVLRNPGGKTIDLTGEPGYPVLRNSAFSADGATLVAMWGGYHGIPVFVKYNSETGKVAARITGVGDYNKLPGWAKPVAKGEASLEHSE